MDFVRCFQPIPPFWAQLPPFYDAGTTIGLHQINYPPPLFLLSFTHFSSKKMPKCGPFPAAMFYACLSILVLLLIMLACVCLSIIDLETYNFGLYIVLLCIVGTMLACALCVANPNACPNPGWYSNFCLMLQEMYPSPSDVKSAAPSTGEMNGLRTRMMALHGIPPTVHTQQPSSSGGGATLRQESRATVAMLAPAVHIMHQVWRGMAWVAEGMDEEEDLTKSYDHAEQGTSRSVSQEEGTDSAQKRLSTIAESSSSAIEAQEELSSEFASGQDVIV